MSHYDKARAAHAAHNEQLRAALHAAPADQRAAVLNEPRNWLKDGSMSKRGRVARHTRGDGGGVSKPAAY
jgi:hypothetical protein